jgi:hypothetical protein
MDENNLVKAIKKIQAEYELDIKFDELTQEEMLLKIPSLKSKWSTYLSVHEAELKQMKCDRDELLENIKNTIKEKSLKPITNNAAENMARKSKKFIENNEKIKQMEGLIIYLERLHTNMQSMTWEMKNLIDYQKRETY